MLTEKDFLIIEKQAIKLYSTLELNIIKEIAERISNVGYANTVVYNNAVILQQMGLLYDDIIKIVAEYNNKSILEIEKIFEEAGIKSIKRDDIIYKNAGLKPKKISDEMKSLIKRRSQQTSYNINSLTGTIANQSQIQFIEAVNNAYLETTTGSKSYSQAISDELKKVSQKGVQIQYPSGHKISIESAIRMNVLTGTNQMSGELQIKRGRELGWNLFEVSAHIGARPEHAEWQGKVYTEEELYTVCGYGTVTGLCGVNCRHTIFPYFKGSTKKYTNKELQQMNKKNIEYQGKKYNEYEISQIQRNLERNIRTAKKELEGIKGISTNINNEEIRENLNKAKINLKNKNAKLNNFLEETGLRKDNSRLVI